jgi:hypothetical protein
MSAPTPDELGRSFAKIMDHRDANGGKHLHHRHCIHNLPPADQIALRAPHWTVDKWLTIMGSMPEQITPEQWECEPPL